MSVPYYIKQGQQSKQISNPEQLREQVLDKVVLGLVVATLLSVFLSEIGVPPGVYFLAVGAEFIIIIAAIFAKSEPTLEKLYYAFVAATAVTLGFTIQIFLSIPNGMEMIATAFGSTSVIVGGIYYYTKTNKPDTSNMIKFLLPATLILFVIFIVGFFIAFSNTTYLLLSIGGAILFSLYLFYDLGRLMNDQYRSPSRMAFMIFWDIILIFKYILNILYFSNRR